MNRLAIQMEKLNYRPGEVAEGRAAWELEDMPDSIEIRLFWYTTGKGDQDVGVVDRVRVDTAGPRGQCRFTFDMPNGPYSFSGTLISLVWAIECVVSPGSEVERQIIFLSPTGEELNLATQTSSSP